MLSRNSARNLSRDSCTALRRDRFGAKSSGLVETIREKYGRLDTVVHSIAFANREDLSRAFVETSRDGYLLAQEVSAIR